jgi:uncharacterized protein
MTDYYVGKYIIITGASMGLGKAFAEQFASKGCNLILLALPEEDLPGCCEAIAVRHNVKVLFYETDLRKGDNIVEFANWVKEQQLEIAGLVNNAGMGGSACFDTTDLCQIDNMLLVNVRALTLMSRYFIPELKKRDSAFIFNISSIAAFKPMPFKTVYPASKAFVYSFSVGLSEELKNTPVHVSVLHPGPMDTSQENAQRLNKHGFLGKLVHLSVDEVAEIGVRNLIAGKKIIVPGYFNRVCINLLKFIPRTIAMPILFKVLRKEVFMETERQRI